MCLVQCCWPGSVKMVTTSTVRLKTYYIHVPHINCSGEVGELNRFKLKSVG